MVDQQASGELVAGGDYPHAERLVEKVALKDMRGGRAESGARATASASNCSVDTIKHDGAVVAVSVAAPAAAAPCFPACMDEISNQREDTAMLSDGGATESDLSKGERTAETLSSAGARKARRSSRRLSQDDKDNQRAHDALMTEDLEDFAHGVLSPGVDHAPPKSIVVDYEEGVPDRSRATLLLDHDSAVGESDPGDCARDACQPLDAVLASAELLDELSIDDGSSADRRRPRMPSLTAQGLLTPTSRRGKSVILNAPELKTLITPASPTRNRNDKLQARERELQREHEPEPERCSVVHKLCLCEVRLHTTRESCWLVANSSVYDVTGVIATHPAGPRSILRKAGGTDCTQDMKFHSKSARKLLEKCFIGKLEPCGENPEGGGGGGGACTIM